MFFRIEKVRGSIHLSSTVNAQVGDLGIHASLVCESLFSPPRKSRDPYPARHTSRRRTTMSMSGLVPTMSGQLSSHVLARYKTWQCAETLVVDDLKITVCLRTADLETPDELDVVKGGR